ncbi:FxSxx-COOH system tetratricopeptide repeat protein [Streptomyces sp. NRRL S-244]|uniref:FxSxx-COOH system tetratricopeptide repeat protein n=1 Tax=Streptomyces sp. NRRL S-244 TaxID=1463897 RepID=UPI00131A4FD4|nr:FxSxx-COOH system tetratricopeptide repeat protein [Streptomyces sp. NRRL S-244]
MPAAVGVPLINFRAHELRTGSVDGARAEFEKMIAELAGATTPNVRRIEANPGDWGVDAFAGDLGGAIAVWQCKYFMPVTTTSHSQQIRESFAQALKAAQANGHTITEWVLCIPSCMDGPAAKWWDGWKKRTEQGHGVVLRLWDETELMRRLHSPEGDPVRRAYFEPRGTSVELVDKVSNVRSGLFIGRAGELRALDAAFSEAGHAVVHTVHGLGGVGKSALAAHWAAGRPEAVRWWITADSTSAVDAGLAALARALHPRLTSQPAEEQTETVMRWLATHDQWLLVLDNVEDPAHIRPLLDRIPGGLVLITSRRATGWHHDATSSRLGTLSPTDAVELFARVLTHHGPRETGGANALCEELGYLALAVEQAAAYCAETGITPRDYLGMLAEHPATVFAAGPEGSESDRTVALIWRLTLDRLTDTPLAGDIQRILAWYSPDRIPRDLLDALAEPPERATAIGRLIAYSMVVDNHDGTLSVHRLVQALARTADPRDPHRRTAAINQARGQATTLLANAFPTELDQPRNWPRFRALLPHSDTLTSLHTPDHDTVHTARILNCAAVFRQAQGLPAAIVPTFERVLDIRERVLGSDHPHTLISRNNLAYAYQEAGQPGRAIPLYERTLREFERVLGDEHPDTMMTSNNLAGAHQKAGDIRRAIQLFERTLQDRERVLGKRAPDTLVSRNNLAAAYQEAGDVNRAIPVLERSLEECERVLGDDHPTTLTFSNNLAAAYQEAGDADHSILLYERTLEICERVLGKDHPTTIISREDLAAAYRAAGDLDRAITLHKRTLHGQEQELGQDHPNTLASRSNLALLYAAAGDLNRATRLYEVLLKDCERVLRSGDPVTAQVRANLERVRSM